MPFFRFTIHGQGKFKDEKTIGFYTTRWCWAPDEKRAADKALNFVRRDWESGRSSEFKGETAPTLEIDKGWRIGVLEIWNAPNRGNVFYGPDDDTGPIRYEILE